MRRYRWGASLAAMCAGVAVGLAAAGTAEDGGGYEWPQFRGPDRDGKSPETGLPRSWPEGGPRLLWRSAEAGGGFASVAVAGGRVFTAGVDGAQELVVAFDLDGKVLWKTPNGSRWRGSTPGSRATPTVRGGMVYHMNPTGRLAAFSADDGREVWSVDLKERFGASHGAWAMSESVLVEGDAVLCAPGGTRGCVVALDRKSGAPLWVNAEIAERAAYCSPAVVTHNGVRQMLTLLGGSVVSVETATGKTLWTFPHATPYGVNVITPLYHDGLVFVTGGYGLGGVLLRIADDGRGVAPRWRGAPLDTCHGGVILLDGYLYGSTCEEPRRGFACIAFMTGKRMWTDATIGKVSLIWADGLLYCFNDKGQMWLVPPDPKACRPISGFQVPMASKNPSLAHPAICNGRLYARTFDELFVYELKASPAPAAGTGQPVSH